MLADLNGPTARRPLSILLASNFYPPHVVGGAEIVVERHARKLAQRGHQVLSIGGSVPAPGRPAGSLEPEGQRGGVDVQRLALRSLGPDDSFRWPSVAGRLSAFIATREIDVVHLHNLVGIGVDSILAVKAAGKRCIVTLHDHWGFCLRQTLLRPDGAVCADFEGCAVCQRSFTHEGETLPIRIRRDFIAWCLEQADMVLAPSAYLAGAYSRAGITPRRIDVLSNGIDVDAIPPSARPGDGVIRFLCSATMAPHKGILVLLDAIKLLASESALTGRWEVVLAGDGPLRGAADALAATLSDEGQPAPLIVTGHLKRSALLARMAATNVVMLPSIWPENEPVSLMEGVASGAALLVTGIGGSPELVRHGETGLEVPPGDANALAGAMRRLITEEGLADRLGATNQTRRTAVDEADSVERLERIYRSDDAAPDVAGAPVVLVGRGTAPEPIIELVSQLHRHLASRPLPRLLRYDWVTEAAWAQASLLWLVDAKDAENAALEALRRDIPVLAPAGIGLEHWIGTGAPLLTYRTPLEALAGLQVLLDRPGIHAHFLAQTSIAEDAVWAAPRGAFALHAPTLD